MAEFHNIAPEPKHTDDAWDQESRTVIEEEPEFIEAILQYRMSVRRGINKQRAAESLVERIDYLVCRSEDRATDQLEERARQGVNTGNEYE